MTKKQHLISSLIFLAFSALLFGYCYSKLGETNLAIHPYMMPTLTSGIMLLMSAIRLVISLRMPADSGAQASKRIIEIPKNSLITIALVIVYAYCMKPVGFIITTFIYMMLQMMILKKENRNWIVMIISSLVMSVGVYLLFVHVFNILLPQGILTFI